MGNLCTSLLAKNFSHYFFHKNSNYSNIRLLNPFLIFSLIAVPHLFHLKKDERWSEDLVFSFFLWVVLILFVTSNLWSPLPNAVPKLSTDATQHSAQAFHWCYTSKLKVKGYVNCHFSVSSENVLPLKSGLQLLSTWNPGNQPDFQGNEH